MNNINIKKFGTCAIVGLTTLAIPLTAMSLTVVNHIRTWRDKDDTSLNRVSIQKPNSTALANQNSKDSCWGNATTIIEVRYLVKNEMFSTGIPINETRPASQEYVCIYTGQNRQFSPGTVPTWNEWAINPIRDVPECTIEFVEIHEKQNGRANATPACGYVGKCADGNDYSDRQACCPTGYWSNNSCSTTLQDPTATVTYY